jgi:hypothetical protein
MSDLPVARPLPKHRITETQIKRIHSPNIQAFSGIRTHDPSVRASEDRSYVRPRGYCDLADPTALLYQKQFMKQQ